MGRLARKALVMPGMVIGCFGGLRGPAFRARVPGALPLVKALVST
jgi:hypothetical protein